MNITENRAPMSDSHHLHTFNVSQPEFLLHRRFNLGYAMRISQ
jgi:hypothetical protein